MRTPTWVALSSTDTTMPYGPRALPAPPATRRRLPSRTAPDSGGGGGLSGDEAPGPEVAVGTAAGAVATAGVAAAAWVSPCGVLPPAASGVPTTSSGRASRESRQLLALAATPSATIQPQPTYARPIGVRAECAPRCDAAAGPEPEVDPEVIEALCEGRPGSAIGGPCSAWHQHSPRTSSIHPSRAPPSSGGGGAPRGPEGCPEPRTKYGPKACEASMNEPSFLPLAVAVVTIS